MITGLWKNKVLLHGTLSKNVSYSQHLLHHFKNVFLLWETHLALLKEKTENSYLHSSFLKSLKISHNIASRLIRQFPSSLINQAVGFKFCIQIPRDLIQEPVSRISVLGHLQTMDTRLTKKTTHRGVLKQNKAFPVCENSY